MANRTRKHEIKYRQNDKEHARFTRMVQKSGLTQQAFIKKAIDGAKLVEQPPVEFFEVLKELREIKMHMTFLWTSAHEAGDYRASQLYYDDVQKLEQLISQLMGAYLHGIIPDHDDARK